ncbi:hypothetical protein BDZ97DRAFT_1918293 [Flammula alnicola]|nr:hypothetical protein BDZ97DRAFT_1918293 [Flammula alnicola]
MSQRLVLVTGISGFIAGHVALQLIEQGYRVRGTARASKLDRYDAVDIPGFEVTEVNDLANDDLTSALKVFHEDVDVVMHIAAPLPGKDSVEGTISAAVEGTLNIVRQAEKAGITKIVVTATFGNVLDPSQAPAFTGATFTDSGALGPHDDGKIRQRPDDYFHIYFASKNLAEKALWDLRNPTPTSTSPPSSPDSYTAPSSKACPHPQARTSSGPTSGRTCSSTAAPPDPTSHPPGSSTSATSHVHTSSRSPSPARSPPPTPPPTPTPTPTPPPQPNLKRFLVNAGNLTWGDAAEHLRTTVPGATIAPLENFVALPGPASSLDTTRAREVLGLTAFIDPRKTMEDVAVDMLRLQKTWHAAQPRN